MLEGPHNQPEKDQASHDLSHHDLSDHPERSSMGRRMLWAGILSAAAATGLTGCWGGPQKPPPAVQRQLDGEMGLRDSEAHLANYLLSRGDHLAPMLLQINTNKVLSVKTGLEEPRDPESLAMARELLKSFDALLQSTPEAGAGLNAKAFGEYLQLTEKAALMVEAALEKDPSYVEFLQKQQHTQFKALNDELTQYFSLCEASADTRDKYIAELNSYNERSLKMDFAEYKSAIGLSKELLDGLHSLDKY